MTNWHRFGGLKEHRFIIQQLWRSELWHASLGLKSRCWQRWFLLEGLGENLFPCLVQILEAACITLFMAPSSIFKASSIESPVPLPPLSHSLSLYLPPPPLILTNFSASLFHDFRAFLSTLRPSVQSGIVYFKNNWWKTFKLRSLLKCNGTYSQGLGSRTWKSWEKSIIQSTTMGKRQSFPQMVLGKLDSYL